MPKPLEEIQHIVRSRKSYEQLTANRDADALYSKLDLDECARAMETSVQYERLIAIGNVVMHPCGPGTAQFGGVHVKEIDADSKYINRIRIRYKSNPAQPGSPIRIVGSQFLELHFHPNGLDTIRRDLKAAGEWMQEKNRSEDFPVVIGCSYRELVSAACRFGLHPVEGVQANPEYRYRAQLSHQVFLMLNNKPLDTPFSLSAAYAPTHQLASRWSGLEVH